MDTQYTQSKLHSELISEPFLLSRNVRISLLHLDKLDSKLGGNLNGNKALKFKKYLEKIQQEKIATVVTFGGCYSNHLLAMAMAAQHHNFKAIGVVRNDGNNQPVLSYILQRAQSLGMEFYFVSRSEYSRRYESEYHRELSNKFNGALVVPEGANSKLGYEGVYEFFSSVNLNYDYVACSVGTGSTFSAIAACTPHQAIKIGFSSLSNIKYQIEKIAKIPNTFIYNHNKFGGYGKVTTELVAFMQYLNVAHGVNLDAIYNAKTMLNLFHYINDKAVCDSSILYINTGGVHPILPISVNWVR